MQKYDRYGRHFVDRALGNHECKGTVPNRYAFLGNMNLSDQPSANGPIAIKIAVQGLEKNLYRLPRAPLECRRCHAGFLPRITTLIRPYSPTFALPPFRPGPVMGDDVGLSLKENVNRMSPYEHKPTKSFGLMSVVI